MCDVASVERRCAYGACRVTEIPIKSGEPDFKLGGFSLWVFGQQFPNAADFWDGNWLNVRARVDAPGLGAGSTGSVCFRPRIGDHCKGT